MRTGPARRSSASAAHESTAPPAGPRRRASRCSGSTPSGSRSTRAIEVGRLSAVLVEAAELDWIDLDDALQILLLMARERDPRLDPSATAGSVGFSRSARSGSLTAATRSPWSNVCRIASSRNGCSRGASDTAARHGYEQSGSRYCSPRNQRSMVPLIKAGCRPASLDRRFSCPGRMIFRSPLGVKRQSRTP
jgi:hypothetical protein